VQTEGCAPLNFDFVAIFDESKTIRRVAVGGSYVERVFRKTDIKKTLFGELVRSLFGFSGPDYDIAQPIAASVVGRKSGQFPIRSFDRFNRQVASNYVRS